MIHLQSETRQYCSLEAMEPVTSTSIWNPTVSQAITSPLYEIQVRLCNQVLSQEDYLVCSKEKSDKQISKNSIYCRTPAQNRDTRWSLQSKDRTIALISLSPQM